MSKHFLVRLLGLIVLVGVTACSQKEPPPQVIDEHALAADEFSVMTYNLDRYGYHDRTGDGQANDMKPDEERAAILEIIRSSNPDILAVQEMGSPLVFEEFRAALKQVGLNYEFHEILQRDQSEMNLAVLSRYPITYVQLRDDDVYTIVDDQWPVERGYIDVLFSINPTYQFRMMIAQLKSKAYHASGQTEMRRNEARLLNKHVRHALKQEPRLNLLVVGDMNDHVGSAALRTLMGNDQEYLIDLRPVDPFGEIWTVFDPENEQYLRYEYMLASPYMLPEYRADKSRVVRHEAGARASRHRPLLAVFKAKEISPDNLPLLPSYEDEDEE